MGITGIQWSFMIFLGVFALLITFTIGKDLTTGLKILFVIFAIGFGFIIAPIDESKNSDNE